MSPCRESCHPVPTGRGPGEPPAIPSWCCRSSSILWDNSPAECCSRDEGMIPPPHFTPRDKLITLGADNPKAGAACKLQLPRREQTAPRLVSRQGNPAPGSSAPALFHLARLLLVPREFPEGCRDAGNGLGCRQWSCGSVVPAWAQPGHITWEDVGRGVEQSLWQQLEPLPPADSHSALLSI